ncbi:protein lava lamp-like [Spodoptera frugiperda]|uniref:Protein lava lamp-like n=1 Tax=Spodoptera frugiperda TaxID=7108 RepID=A0A9R0CWJ0_SPOFR|nr:protein lava lamp-like [Spodoptera frugiperda]
MSDNKNNNPPEREQSDTADSNIASSEVSSVVGSVKTSKTSQRVSSSSERQIKFERAQKCLENAALVSKRIKEHRKATAELLGRPFEDDDGGDTASELASTVSERTGYSAATDTSTTLSVQDALNIPGISESLANTLKQKELLMERIRQYKEISKKPMTKPTTIRRESTVDTKVEVKKVQPAESSNVTQLLNTIKEKENSLSVMQVKIRAMETTILDLQEMINEKDQIIEAKNKATTLMSDTLSKKEKDSLILLEDTRQQMTKMQENFIAMETEWKEEKQNLLKEIAIKDEKITSLEEANTILETSRFEISVAHSKLAEELEAKNLEILRLQEKIEGLSQIPIDEPSPKEKDDVEEEKGSLEIAGMAELTKKIELLEQLNCQIRQTNKELENKLATVNTEPKSPSTAAAGKKGSPLTTRKGGRNTAAKSKSPWSQLSSESLPQETDKKAAKSEIARLEMLVQSLNKDILEKEYAISEKDALITQLQNVPVEIEQKKTVEMVDIGLCTDIPEDNKLSTQGEIEKQDSSVELKSDNEDLSINELQEKLKAAEEQIVTLNNEIDAANKNMIKVKSNHKLKLKQLQKTIDNFSKVSDTNAEIIKLNEEIHQLSQKVAELEEEKGNLQLHLVDYDSGRLTDSDIYKKMVEMENLAETRLKAISVLETQKFDLVQELHILQQKNDEMEDKLADISQLQSEHVCTEMKSVQMEEQIDELTAAKKELELVIENLKLDKEHLNDTIKHLQDEKEEMTHKLENYIQENMELTDKLEKLSAEKVSSAESIEIVESLTTQEKLELEEYNKGIIEGKGDDHHQDHVESQNDKNIDSLIEQREELNTKIELFTQERQEVMEKMSKIGTENESLLEKISELNNQCSILQSSIDLLNNEKQELQGLNQELTQQIEELKRERIEIMKETAETAKPVAEDTTDGVPVETHHDDKSAGDKGSKGAKSVKQLTKEILKLKNIIKEREDEIGDCQMKILSMEEQQQKQKELLQTNASYESKIKSLIDENMHLKQDLDVIKKETESKEQVMRLKQSNEELHQELQKVHQEYAVTVGYRDAKINELENVLLEYEKQMFNYGNSLQQKDKEMAEYINQITKLNDVSQKLKSTIELLEEEKAKDQNAELVKALNKQIAACQKKMAENEEKIKNLEDEKAQLQCHKGELVNKNTALDAELKKLKDSFAEKQTLIKELQTQQQKHSAEMSSIKLQITEKDEEIHEIKLQLRKESIENEKLRDNIVDKEKQVDELTQQIEETKEKLNNLSTEKNNSSEQFVALETKNKELLEKLKKFAISIKKKSSMYSELEALYEESQKQLSTRNEQVEQLTIQVETLPALQEKLKLAEEEMNRLQSQRVSLEQQRTQDINQFQTEIKALQERLIMSSQEITHLNDSVNVLHKDLHFAREENDHFKAQIDALNNKLVEYEIEQKNNSNLITKISSLEADIAQKQNQIAELLTKVEHYEQQQTQVQFGYDAKVQERDLYIENLETEISKYKNRICRLEESISVMEDRRHSLERKADQLGSQLQEKQKAYTEYTSQEDELVGRLAVLMDHDRVLEKQLFEIENENKELQYKVQHFNEDNQKLRKALSEIQEHYSVLLDKANKLDPVESELSKCQVQLRELEANLKKITHDHQSLIAKKKQEIEELETEFNTQIENAIKEKKALSEKYEKVNERTSRLEAQLLEYKTNIENLNINIEELNRINHELENKSKKEESETPDYTEQYINEINKLNAMVNAKNQENLELKNALQTQQATSVSVSANMESQIAELNAKLIQSASAIEQLTSEINNLRGANEQLYMQLTQKDEHIRELKDNQKLTFEMNIPKTEGMIISSTIEPVSGTDKNVDMSALESQIVSGMEEPLIESKHVSKKVSEHIQKQPTGDMVVEEPLIVAKKAYDCYTKDDDENVAAEVDPFNSDEGWGLGECEETSEVTPGFSHFKEQINQLQKDNDTLKSELEVSNMKLQKALIKLKEFKASNALLTNELKLAKQISQTSFFDNAMEDELRMNVQELEKKIEELNTEIMKEKRDKESLRKQNEVFHNANDRLTEMKEKLDNEIELWKFKFKEANDKLSSMQWGGDAKESQPQEQSHVQSIDENKYKEELIKIEKENDELQSALEELNSQNNEYVLQQTQLKNEISNLHNQLQHHQSVTQNYEVLKNQLDEMQKSNEELVQTNESLTEKLQNIEKQYNDLTQSYDKLNLSIEEIKTNYEQEKAVLVDRHSSLEEEVIRLQQLDSESKTQISSLYSELENVKSKLLFHEEQEGVNRLQSVDSLALAEKCSAMEQHCIQLKHELDVANSKILQLESENQELIQKSKEYQDQINDLNIKMQNLNGENDNLLSTVAELRSSVSSAIDQRGFEIAELWKQHLAQREADFQKIESDLRTQLNASEAKYEQLLENVQSSNQEETSKLIVIEQVTSLQSKLEDKEEHVRNLQVKYAEVMNQLDMLRSEMEDEKVGHENKLLEQQEEYEKMIQEMTVKHHKHNESYDETFKNMQNEIIALKTNNDELNQVIEDLRSKLKESEESVIEATNQLRLKESEIYQKTHDYTITLTQRNEEFENVRKQLIEYEKRVEDLSYEKESELALLRLKMHENDTRYENMRSEAVAEREKLVEELNAKIVECTNLNKQIVDLNQELESHSAKAAEMQAALENQEIDIVGLNDEITNLQNMLKSSSTKVQKHVSFASDTKPGAEGEQTQNTLNKDLLDAVPRAELDLALYMLHQRDVRCEELTMELTQLLEERDTLQLRLSDCLRLNEDLKNKFKMAGFDESMNSSQETISEQPSFTVEREFVDIHRGQTSRSSSISDPDGEKPKLQAKLTELRSVKHSRDVRLRQESEQRQLDLRLLQRDVAHLPPEAVDQLAQAHHTLSRDSQSTSTVLLNWLRGKSTPKVVHM